MEMEDSSPRGSPQVGGGINHSPHRSLLALFQQLCWISLRDYWYHPSVRSCVYPLSLERVVPFPLSGLSPQTAVLCWHAAAILLLKENAFPKEKKRKKEIHPQLTASLPKNGKATLGDCTESKSSFSTSLHFLACLVPCSLYNTIPILLLYNLFCSHYSVQGQAPFLSLSFLLFFFSNKLENIPHLVVLTQSAPICSSTILITVLIIDPKVKAEEAERERPSPIFLELSSLWDTRHWTQINFILVFFLCLQGIGWAPASLPGSREPTIVHAGIS